MYNFYQNNNERIYKVLDATNILKTNYLLLTTALPVASSTIWLSICRAENRRLCFASHVWILLSSFVRD